MTEQINFKHGILREFNIRKHLCTFLENVLPRLSGRDWWNRRVLRHLKRDQPDIRDWSGLDIRVLLHILRENLYDICREFKHEFTEYNPLVWEMITIRHIEAHFTEDLPSKDVYRYIGTLERFAAFIENQDLLKELQTTKRLILKNIQTKSRYRERSSRHTVADLVTRATTELCLFLETILSTLSDDWWDEKVINELSPKERKVVRDKRINTLDSKVLFRVLDRNWKDICGYFNWPENDNYYLILTVRRILDSRATDTEDIYRDLDTLERFVAVLKGSELLLNDIQSAKEPLLKKMQSAIAKAESKEEAYRRKISIAQPGCIVILADQSESMDEPLGDKTKAEIVTQEVNTTIAQLITVCTRGEEIKDRCRICVIGYGEEVTYIVNDMVSKLYKRPETGKRVPTWLTPKASNTTPMTEAFELAYQVVEKSCSEHTESFPPIVINITDGVPNDYESTKDAANKIMELHTKDGNALVFNVHIADSGKEISFPNSTVQFEKEPYAEYAEFLFGISSVLPESLLDRAKSHGFSPLPGSRCLGYNAASKLMIRLLRFGSQPTRKGRQERRPVPRTIANN